MDKENMAMYSEAHESYDLTNHLLSFFTDSSVRKRAANEVLKTRPGKVLDIATGTGDTAMLVAKAAQARGQKVAVTAMDANIRMLSTARAKARKEGLVNVHFEEGDSSSLRYPDGSFDAVVCTFALKNLDIERFASESYRVLRKNGILVIADISAPQGLLNRAMFRIYLGYMGLFGWLTGKKLYKWLPGSTNSFDKSKFLKVLSAKRFHKARSSEFFFGITYILTYIK